MTKLIKNWKGLSKVAPNDKYRIIVDLDMCCGWIIPVTDEPTGEGDEFVCHCENNNNKMATKEYFKHHVYLSTHTFYGSNYKYSTKVLQEHGFNIEIDNWDKKGCEQMVGYEFDYSEYGVFNGKPMLPTYNREQRRKYIKENKNNPIAEKCPFCKAKTLRLSDDNCDICCELCGKIVDGKGE